MFDPKRLNEWIHNNKNQESEDASRKPHFKVWYASAIVSAP